MSFFKVGCKIKLKEAMESETNSNKRKSKYIIEFSFENEIRFKINK